MGKIKKSCAFLCLATFSLGFALIGCNDQKGDANETTFTVTFDTQGGSAIEAQVVKYGEKVAKPADPTKTNFTFNGWYEDAAAVTKFDFDLEITADWTIYAGWKAGSVDPEPGPGPEPEPSDDVLYFKDAKWWNKDAAQTWYSFDDAEPATMEYVTISGGINYWKVDLPDNATSVKFSRRGSDGAFWGAETNALTLSDRGEHNMYDISASTEAWKDQSKYAEGVWATYVEPTPDPKPEPGTNVTYTLTCTSTWDIHEAGAVFYAWAWGEGIDGAWYALTGEAKVFTIELPNTLNKCKVVRMNPVGAPSWNDGVKWNESNEITLDPNNPTAEFTLG